MTHHLVEARLSTRLSQMPEDVENVSAPSVATRARLRGSLKASPEDVDSTRPGDSGPL